MYEPEIAWNMNWPLRFNLDEIYRRKKRGKEAKKEVEKPEDDEDRGETPSSDQRRSIDVKTEERRRIVRVS